MHDQRAVKCSDRLNNRLPHDLSSGARAECGKDFQRDRFAEKRHVPVGEQCVAAGGVEAVRFVFVRGVYRPGRCRRPLALERAILVGAIKAEGPFAVDPALSLVVGQVTL